MNGNVVDFNVAKFKKLNEQITTCRPIDDKPLVPDPAYNIIDVRWYKMSNGDMERREPIGVILVEDWNGRYVWAAMGTGQDPQNIAAWGAHLTREVAEAMFGYEMPDYKVR